MLSRLSGLANTVLQELSGDGEDAGSAAMPAGAESEASQQNGEETPEDLLERLAHTERLVVQLKNLVREKDAQLQQKDALLQEERQAAEAKLLKLKLQAKAKLATLNKRIEELTEQGAAVAAKDLPEEPPLPAKVQSDQKACDRQEEKTEVLQRQLQEQEEMVEKLQGQLEAVTGNLHEVKTQLSSLQEEIKAKDSRFEEQALKYQAELHRLAAQSALEAEMQQNLRLLQRKLEEQEEALLGRTQVVELLQQELSGVEEKKQVLQQKFQEAEAELDSLRNTLSSERQGSQSLVGRLELELAEQKLSFHRLQEDVQQFSEELARARAAQAAEGRESRAAQERHAEEMEEKSQEIAALRRAEQDLRSSCEGLRAQNALLLQEAARSPKPPAGDGSMQQGKPPASSKESGSSQADAEALTAQTAGQAAALSEAVAEEDAAAAALPVRNLQQQENEQHKVLAETLEAGNETLRSQLATLGKRLEFTAGATESSQVGCSEMGVESQPQQTPSGFSDSSPGPGGLMEGLESNSAEDLHSPDTPAALTQPSKPNGSPLEPPPATGNGHPSILEYLSAKKRQDLSVLLLELQEAQEEIAFLKGQLPASGSFDPDGVEQPSGQSQASGAEEGGDGPVLMQSDSSSSSLVTVDIQEESPPPPLPGVIWGQGGPCTEDTEATREPSPATSLSEPRELTKLQLEMAELRAGQREAQELHERALEERAAEIGRLQQLVEGSDRSLRSLTAERDQLLSQREELRGLAELKQRVKQLEGDLADAEKRRLSHHESGISQLGLLREQVQSLSNEAKSKEVKIAALQKDLDEAQRRLTEHDLLGRSLSGRLQEEEREREGLARQLREASAGAEELSWSLASKELEAARLEQLLAQSATEAERLQQEVAERERRMAELNAGMSDRMVQLNEEKFVLGQELASLTERLSLLMPGKETRDQGVGTGAVQEEEEKEEEEEEPPEQQAQRASPAGEEGAALRKENERLRKKLQAALVSRKELQGKVRKLEAGREQPAKPGATALEAQQNAAGGAAGEAAAPESSREAGGDVFSAKEAELLTVLGEKESAVAALQAVITELQQSLQEKDLLVGALQAELAGSGSASEKPAPVDQSLAVSGAAVPLAQGGSAGGAEPCLEEGQRAALAEKLCAVEQERDQLQKKLREALASRKDTVKKAQEKDRLHREQLKQRKEDYGLLQEQFEQQSREKESLQGQLQALNQALEGASLPKPAEEVPPEEPASGAVQESGGAAPVGSAASGGGFLAAEDVAAERLRGDLEELQAEKGELAARVSHLERALGSESEVTGQLREQVRQLLAELEALKAACGQAEAGAVSLRLELEESRAAVARQEGLRLQQTNLEEQRGLASKEEIGGLNSQLAEKEESLRSLQAELRDREGRIEALQSQLAAQSKEQAQRLQAEAQQKSAEDAAEGQSRAQLQRKLQAALISRKDALRESKLLKEELAGARAALESASLRLSDAESRASELGQEKEALLEKMAALGEEREKLIAEVDKALVENQNVSGSCESLKLALEGVAREKARLEDQVGALHQAQAQALSERQEKHQELQREYETLLQSYENVSGEAERIRRVAEGVRQEKQELFLRLKGTEAEKREAEARLQGAEQEMDGMREKMRKLAKSKQQKILELEEENEQLRAEAAPAGGGLPGGAEEASASLGAELERSRQDCEVLSAQLEVLMAEKDSLNQQIQDLKKTLQSEEVAAVAAGEAIGSTRVEAPVAADAQASPGPAPDPPVPTAASLRSGGQEAHQGGPPHAEISRDLQQVAQLTEQVADLEEKSRVAAEELGKVLRDLETLGEEKKGLEGLLVARGQELEALREKVARVEQAGQKTEEQLAGAVRLKEALAAEKDDLEERLMNQLAELNGSIGNYQQDVAALQSQNQQLLGEAEGLQGALSRLEEEKRRLLREKGEMAAEKKEHVEKLKSAWKGGSSRTQAKELQELLKEKQQEVRQLQKDCIKSQEKISSLERTVKALEFVQSESRKELEAAKQSVAKAGADTQKAQAELASCRVLLDDTQSEAARVLAESLKVKEELQASKAQAKAQLRQQETELEWRLGAEKDKHSKEVGNMEERLEALQRERGRAEGAARDLQEALRRKDQEAKQLQGSLNRTLAQLAAFTRSMSSLQDDRDRVIDESRQWEKKFSEAIEKKEQEVRAQEQACAGLEEQAKLTAAQVEDLQSRLASLEHNKLAQESSAQKELQRHQEEANMLQEEKRSLAFQLEEAQQRLSSSQNLVQKQEAELQNLGVQLADLQDSFAKVEEARNEMEKTAKTQEANLQECRFSLEQLEADLQASKELTDRLHEEMSSKDQKIIDLVASKEETMAAAVSELQQRHKEELKELENRMDTVGEERMALEIEKSKALEKVGRLMGKLKSAREESRQHKAQLDSFTKSMSSLQDDRDRVLADYRQLEQRHLAAILGKDQLIQEAAAENNALKEELRGLHGRMDDLHAENAKLKAELVRYREDLNQLITIKDGQQKQLLQTQLERIQALEKEKAGVEGQLRESECASATLRQSGEALLLEKHSMGQEVEALQASLSRLQSEMAALHEGGPMLELQAQLQGKVEEGQELSGRLSLAQQRVAELEEELALVRQSTAQKMHEAEAQMKKELKSLHHDAGLMRNETETAEERVAELAKDLLEMEQKLLAATEENQDLKAQIQSFRKAMSSLQDSWDQSNEALRATEKKYAVDLGEQRLLVQDLRQGELRWQEEQLTLAKQRDALASELAALRGAVEEKGLLARLEKLGRQLQAKDVELARLTSELEGASGQVKSFAKAMASLQGERDRLLSELDNARKAEEVKLQSAAQPPAGLDEVPSLKKALSSLQNDRDRLLVELKNLQQQYIQVGVDTAEITRLKAQLQEQKQEAEQQRHLQEQLKQESTSWQRELQQLREAKAAWELEASAAKEQQRGHLQRAGAQVVEEEQHQRQAAPEVPPSSKAQKGEASGYEATDLQGQLRSSLKELHQKEVRIQQLNGKLSQVFEEKNALSLQLRGSSRSLRETHQCYTEALARCEALEKQLQALPSPRKDRGSLPTDAAPGAPQERSEHSRESYTPELQELQMRLSDAKQEQSSAKQGLLRLEEMLQEEQDRRLAAEEAFSAAQEHIRRLESNEWAQPLDTSIEMPSSPEHALLGGPPDGSFSKARGGSGLRRALRSLFCARRRLPLLVTAYLLTVHVLLLLCFTGHL
ncbi:golgin subfamily B member 1 [Elgaria multicarinata webbii]|uniref:golgin subfamily B member 1 n=1 Tax=Elgaria multicarinata webbii TaxID=159646 RepID=UPI002FCCDF46